MAFLKADGVVEALANLAAEHLTSQTLNLGEAGNVVNIQVDVEAGQFVLRTDKGETWFVTPIQLGSRAKLMRDNGVPADFAYQEVRRSHLRYQELEKQWLIIAKVIESVGAPDLDVALQAWVEDVLNEDDRNVWFRWGPGGYATKQERLVINAYS